MLAKSLLSKSIIYCIFSLREKCPPWQARWSAKEAPEDAGREQGFPRCYYPCLHHGYTNLMPSIYISGPQHGVKRGDTRELSSFGEATAKLNDDR